MDIPVDLINVNLDDKEVANINQYLSSSPALDDQPNEDAGKNILQIQKEVNNKMGLGIMGMLKKGQANHMQKQVQGISQNINNKMGL